MTIHLLYSDVHLRPDRLAEADTVFEAIGDGAINHAVIRTGGYVINLGDLFNDRGLIRSACFDMLVAHRMRWRDSGIKHIDLIGNHDQEDRAGRIHPLRIFASWSGWHVIDTPMHLGQFDFFPYTHDLPGALVSMTLPKHDRIAFVHTGFKGARRNEGSVDTDGSETRLVSEYRHVFSGHYHYRHSVKDTNIQYVGSPMQHTFAEMGQAKGYLIYDDVTGVVKFNRIPGTPVHYETRVDAATGEWTDVTMEPSDRLRVVITGAGADMAKWPREKLATMFPVATIKIERKITDAAVSRLALEPTGVLDNLALARKYMEFMEPELDPGRLMAVAQELI